MRTLEQGITSLHGRPRPLTADERAILAEGGREIVSKIRDRWPRDSGFSAARWTSTVSGAQGDYLITISNDADYVQYVHDSGSTAPLWETLVPAVVRALGPGITAAVLEEAEQTEARLDETSGRTGQSTSSVLIDTLAIRFGGV